MGDQFLFEQVVPRFPCGLHCIGLTCVALRLWFAVEGRLAFSPIGGELFNIALKGKGPFCWFYCSNW